MRALDACLGVLEDALERGESLVSPTIPPFVFVAVPAVRPGMPLTDALDLVFQEQAAFLAVAMSEPGQWTERTMSTVEAREITARIKARVDGVAELILEAHDRRAWEALGYHSWERYIKAEFGFSRSRSYEMLDQARVKRALKAAAAGRPVPYVSARTAAAIRPVLPKVANVIQGRLRAEAPDPDAVVREVIRDTLSHLRHQIPANVEPVGSLAPAAELTERAHLRAAIKSGAIDLDTLVAVVDFLAEMPSVLEIWPALSDSDLRRLSRLPAASHRLHELARQWDTLRLEPVSEAQRDVEPLSRVG
jgi:hypothetical protein